MADKKNRAVDSTTAELETLSKQAVSDQASANRDVLPEDFATIQEFWEFWDTHSTADYEDALEDVTFEVDLTSSKMYFPVAKDLLEKVRIHARRQGVSPETLINLWLQERLSKSA
jgi:hypothetical protein